LRWRAVAVTPVPFVWRLLSDADNLGTVQFF
jgi:hypothetical protein